MLQLFLSPPLPPLSSPHPPSLPLTSPHSPPFPLLLLTTPHFPSLPYHYSLAVYTSLTPLVFSPLFLPSFPLSLIPFFSNSCSLYSLSLFLCIPLSPLHLYIPLLSYFFSPFLSYLILSLSLSLSLFPYLFIFLLFLVFSHYSC